MKTYEIDRAALDHILNTLATIDGYLTECATDDSHHNKRRSWDLAQGCAIIVSDLEEQLANDAGLISK